MRLVEQVFILRNARGCGICWKFGAIGVAVFGEKFFRGTLFDTVGVVYFEGRKNITFNQYLLQNKEVL